MWSERWVNCKSVKTILVGVTPLSKRFLFRNLIILLVGPRKKFWENLRCRTKLGLFDGWDSVLTKGMMPFLGLCSYYAVERIFKLLINEIAIARGASPFGMNWKLTAQNSLNAAGKRYEIISFPERINSCAAKCRVNYLIRALKSH